MKEKKISVVITILFMCGCLLACKTEKTNYTDQTNSENVTEAQVLNDSSTKTQESDTNDQLNMEERSDVENDSAIEKQSDVENDSAIEEQSDVENDSAIEEQADEKMNSDTEELQQIHLVMVGDILLHTRVSESAHLPDGSYDYNPIFSNTSDVIEAADLALVNEEVIIGGEELGVSGYPAFNAPYEIGDALVQNGFDVILHATNHAVDKGKKGLHNCMSFWQEHYPDIEVLGIHDSQEDQNTIYYYEQNGMKIAILNYTYGTNGISLPSDMPWSVDLLEKDKVIADLKEAESKADFTIVCPHWGTEYNLGISSEQKKWAQIFVENGADLVIGTHPHVIEPIEWYEDEKNDNSALIFYSIGNYVNWTGGAGAGTANRMVGGMADVTLVQEDGKVKIGEYTVHALVSHLENGTGNVSTYFLRDYNTELASKNEIIKQDVSFSYDYCVNLCNEVWENWE